MKWVYTSELVDYEIALETMKDRVSCLQRQQQSEMIWGLQHPPLFTAGTSSQDHDLLDNLGFPVYQVGRGGKFTYHGPGQLVVYVMIDLEKHHLNIRQYVATLEEWVIDCLKQFDIGAERHDDRIGIWVRSPNGQEEKIAAIGVRVTKGITWHGMAINVSPDLTHFRGIIPCGLSEYGVTSMARANSQACVKEVYKALKKVCPFK